MWLLDVVLDFSISACLEVALYRPPRAGFPPGVGCVYLPNVTPQTLIDAFSTTPRFNPEEEAAAYLPHHQTTPWSYS